MMEKIHTVSTLTELLRQTLQRSLPYVWVRGEITNFSRAASGHLYFSVKDASAQLQCAWFANRQPRGERNFDPLTGEIFETPQISPAQLLRNGMEVICSGSMEVYAPRGQYQLIIEQVQPAGEGLLALEFEQRKKKLAAAGYFNQSRKRAIPANPVKIALVTSPHGAAIHDFIELAGKRGCGSTIRLFPVLVQGHGAAEKMASAIELINAQDWAQLIVLIRGGGSLEDLWAFNEEILADAIFHSKIPIIAGVGHEVDFTLADMTADLRAATPSHAAQLLWPLRSDLWQQLDTLQINLDRVMAARHDYFFREATRLQSTLQWFAPVKRLQRETASLAALAKRLLAATSYCVNKRQDRYKALRISLGANATLQKNLALGTKEIENLMRRLDMAMHNFLASRKESLAHTSIVLKGLNPAAPLERGYAILARGDRIVGGIGQVRAGDVLKAFLLDGSLELTIDEVSPMTLSLDVENTAGGNPV